MKADDLTSIFEPIVWKCGFLDFSQPYVPLRSVTGTASLYLFFYLSD
jgi:hypothetical protein